MSCWRWTGTTLYRLDPPPPDDPDVGVLSDFAGNVVSSSRIDLTWAYTGPAVTFTLTRNGTPVSVPAAARAYSDLGLLGNTTYNYSLVASDGNSNTVNLSRTTSGSQDLRPAPGSKVNGFDTVRIEDLAGSTLQAKLNAARAIPVPTGKGIVVTFGPGEYTFSDFTQASGAYGLRMPYNVGIAGNNRDGDRATVFKMVEGSSTKGPLVPQSTTIGGVGGTNKYTLMAIQHDDDSGNWEPPNGLPFQNFALIGTWQPRKAGDTKAMDPIGHLYNGLRLGHTHNSTLTNVYIEGCPGDQAAPPGETFGVNLYQGEGLTITNVEVSGIRERQGETRRIASSPIGFNSHSDATVNLSYFHDCPWGMPTSYLSHNIVWTDTRSIRCRTGFNHERVTMARHIRPTAVPILDPQQIYKLPTGDPALPGNYNFSFMNDGDGGGPDNGQLYITGPIVYGPTRQHSAPGAPHEGDLVIYQGNRGTQDTQTWPPIVKNADGTDFPDAQIYVVN